MGETQSIGGNYSTWWGTEPEVDENGTLVTPAGGPPKSSDCLGQSTTGLPLAGYSKAEVSISGDSTSIDLGAAAIKGRDKSSAVELEIFSIAAHGNHDDVAVGAVLAHVGASTDDGRASLGIDLLTARAGIGRNNADGSVGWNIGAMATAVGIEGTLPFSSACSVTAGASASVGMEASAGWRDLDGDQYPELCVRGSFEWATLGACLEMPFLDANYAAPGNKLEHK